VQPFVFLPGAPVYSYIRTQSRREMLNTSKLVSCGIRQMSSWQIFGSAVVERKAITVKPFSPLEKAYLDLLHR